MALIICFVHFQVTQEVPEIHWHITTGGSSVLKIEIMITTVVTIVLWGVVKVGGGLVPVVTLT